MATQKVSKFVSHPFTQAVLILTTIIACIVLIVYVVYRISSTSLKAKDVTNSSVVQADGPGLIVKSSELPAMLNGLEFGYSVWLYIDRFEARTAPRQVLAQDTVRVTLGKNENTLKFEFATDGKLQGAGAEIDYVPMARWVHVVMVYREGSVTFFMDGEVHSVKRVDFHPPHPVGDLTIAGGGGSTSTWKGDIGAVVVLNYYPSIADVKKLYWKGPTGSQTLKWVGLNKYGVRTPVYKIKT